MQELSTLKTATGQDVIGTEAGKGDEWLFRRWLLGNGGHDVGDYVVICLAERGQGLGYRLSPS